MTTPSPQLEFIISSAQSEQKFDESSGRGYRCKHCEVRNEVQFCHYYNVSQEIREKVLDSLCNIDLTRFVWGDIQSDEVGLCRGKDCNYCGRYSAELRSKQGEP